MDIILPMLVGFLIAGLGLTLIIRAALFHSDGWQHVWWHECGLTTTDPKHTLCPKCGASNPQYISGIAKRGILWGWHYRRD